MNLANWPVNPGDIFVAVVLLISALLAFARGFARELLSIFSWVGAALITLFVFFRVPGVLQYLRDFISNTLIADGLTAVAIFVVSLIVLSIVSHYLAKLVRGSAVNAVDRSLGFLFGVFRGAVLIVLAFMLYSSIVPEANRPIWLKQARALPMVESAADWAGRVFTERLDEGLSRIDGDEPSEAAELERLSQPQPPPPPSQDTP